MGINPETIMAAVGKYYGIEPEEMKGRGQRYTVVGGIAGSLAGAAVRKSIDSACKYSGAC